MVLTAHSIPQDFNVEHRFDYVPNPHLSQVTVAEMAEAYRLLAGSDRKRRKTRLKIWASVAAIVGSMNTFVLPNVLASGTPDDKLDSDLRSEDYTTGPLSPLSPGEHRRFVDAGFYQGGIIILTPPTTGATTITAEATTAEATSGTSPALALDSPTTTLFTPQQLAQIPPAPEPDPFARVSGNGGGQPDDTAELALTGANTRRISQLAFAALLLGLGLVLFPRRRFKR